ncbi:MAG: FtsW/RodA/SpoVE family cell cycle protein [Patescibacteria group bacterium]
MEQIGKRGADERLDGSQRPSGFDFVLFLALLPLLAFGLFTINSFSGENVFFHRQLIWIALSLSVLVGGSFVDFRFLRKTGILVVLYLGTLGLLLLLFLSGSVFQGAQSWFNFGAFAFQPSDPAKLVLILILAKYFSKRHIEIAHVQHIFVSGLYTLLIFIPVFLQPDFGSAIIIFAIWFGMVLVSGISKKHLFFVFFGILVSFSLAWSFLFQSYQKQRILTFIHPLTDIRGSGYNAYQSTIAVGSGELFGKGVGYGSQSKLKFLPEYETDFVFAAFAEEWGFLGVIILFLLFGVIFWRIIDASVHGASNFETFFCAGLAVLFITHFTVHIGMNIGLLPVTGTTIPFLSYGGSHLLTEFIGLGILMGMRRYSRDVHRGSVNQEMLVG